MLVLLMLGCGASEPTTAPAVVECPPAVECPAVDTTRMGALAFSLSRCSEMGEPIDFPPANLWDACDSVYAEACRTHEGLRQAAAAGVTEYLPCRDEPDFKAAYGDSTK